jgi:tetratricopeptide (TPR) repeat protein
MGLFSQLMGKKSDYLSEYKKYKKALSSHPGDHGLKAQFIKFCLLNRFTHHEVVKTHMTEALTLFGSIENSDAFDLQCHYLVGKYYQEEKDNRKAYQVYLNAIKRFNEYVSKNPGQRSDNAELAYSVALNLMNLQLNPVDPALEKCFKILRKSYPLHLKSIELENEMAKPAPSKERIKQLSAEIKQLRDEENKETTEPVKSAAKEPVKETVKETTTTKSSGPVQDNPAEQKGIFSKLFMDLSPAVLGKSVLLTQNTHNQSASEMEAFKMSPVSDSPERQTAFMMYLDDEWKGPFTLQQIRNMTYLDPATWVCRSGSEQVVQAYEVPDLQPFFKQNA